MILVTGASGLLGSSVVRRALDLGQEVVGIARNGGRAHMPGFQTLDLTDGGGTRSVVLRLMPSIIIHCAAATDVDWCEDHPKEAHEINTAASADLAHLA